MLSLAWIAPLLALAVATPVKNDLPYTSEISVQTKYDRSIYLCHPQRHYTNSVIIPKALLPRWVDCKTFCGDEITILDPKTKRTTVATIIGFDQDEKCGDLIVNESVWKYLGARTCKVDWGFCDDDKDGHKKPQVPPQKPQVPPVVTPRPQTPVTPVHPPKVPATPWVPPRQPPTTPHPSQVPPHPSQASRV